MPPHPTVRSCLSALGPHAPGLLEAINTDPIEFVEAVRRHAHTQKDIKAPMLLSDSDVPSADALYAFYSNGGGGPYFATDKDGSAPAPGKGSVLRGAGIIDACGLACAAVVTSRGWNVEIYVTGAPLAALEAQLFDTRAENCLMLKTWLGFEAAFASQDFRKRLGRELRSIGPSAIDQMLHSSYCLSRTGPAGVFELRPAASAEELRLLFDAVEQGVEYQMTNGVDDPWVETHYANPCEITVHWDTKPSPHWETVSDTSLMHWKKWGQCVPRLADLLLRCPVGGAPACLTFDDKYEASLLQLLEAASTPVPGHERLQLDTLSAWCAEDGSGGRWSEEAEAVGVPMSKDTLFALVGAAVAMCAPRRLGLATDRTCMVDLFEEADALFAVRGLGLTRQAEAEAVVIAVMERVAPPNAALLVVLNDDETIKQCRMLAHGRNTPLTFDAAQRVLSCSWAVPLALKGDCLCILEVAGVKRAKLRLASTYRTAFSRTSGPPPATAGDLAALRTHIESVVAAAATLRPEPPPQAPAAAPAVAVLEDASLESRPAELLLSGLRAAMDSVRQCCVMH